MNNNSNKEKILKGLIIIGIIAISVSVYLQYLKPYIYELQVHKRDLKRIEELTLINSVLNELQKENPDAFLDEPNKVYISIPSANLKCEGLELPSLPEGWEYRCKPETEYRKIDSSGWIPVNFTKLSDIHFEKLPVDAINDASKLYYYAFVGNKEKSEWVLTTLFESKKFLKEKALTDSGTDPIRFEIGSNLKLWSKASGLVGYWSFGEGKGQIATDLSGNNNDGTLVNSPIWANGKVGKALKFDGNDGYVDCGNDPSLNITGAITIEVWVKPTSLLNGVMLVTKALPNTNGYYLQSNADGIVYYVSTSANAQPSVMDALVAGSWQQVVVTRSGSSAKIYINGADRTGTSVSMDDPLSSTRNLRIGESFNGTIDEVRIYNRSLSSSDIQAMYNSTK